MLYSSHCVAREKTRCTAQINERSLCLSALKCKVDDVITKGPTPSGELLAPRNRGSCVHASITGATRAITCSSWTRLSRDTSTASPSPLQHSTTITTSHLDTRTQHGHGSLAHGPRPHGSRHARHGRRWTQVQHERMAIYLLVSNDTLTCRSNRCCLPGTQLIYASSSPHGISPARPRSSSRSSPSSS